MRRDTLLLDSGSQSTAVMPGFAPDFEVDDTDRVTLRDIQDWEIPSYGKNVVDMKL